MFMPLSILAFTIIPVLGISIPRDGAQINAAVGAISDQLVTLNGTLNEFEAGLEGTFVALKILQQASDLNTDVETATNVAQESAPLSDADSSSVAFSVVSLSAKVYDVLDNIVAKKPEFDKAILGIGSGSFLVRSNLQTLRNSTSEFGTAVTAKLVESLRDVAPLVIASVDFHFAQALRVYE
jgi:hypothetical protein